MSLRSRGLALAVEQEQAAILHLRAGHALVRFSGDPKASSQLDGSQAQAGLLELWHHGAIEVLQFLVVIKTAKDDSPDSNRRAFCQFIDHLVRGAHDRTAAPPSNKPLPSRVSGRSGAENTLNPLPTSHNIQTVNLRLGLD
jgi:hypothetical protein